ncbi:glycosyltransferase [Paenibacillus sp. 1001270B_150601_E10]|uniref:glycosyltransferase n=1 Tax=Paenibacillus sp. 1001270B_150601_E10 TaxID=2787079 RepID=UPI00189E083A|nr:tetratricopeptide repeat protein [Paenibacillus sp. 1001270B_150601_E10]
MYLQRPTASERIGVLILACDEASVIGSSIASAEGADEIIVADTGSSDGTPQLARDLGATVVTLKWEHHFAKARNEALLAMSAEWILVLDADERLQTPIADIRALIANTEASAFTVLIRNRLSEHANHFVQHRSVRLFRNQQSYRYEGLIHEDIGPSIIHTSGTHAITDSSIQLEHSGTLPSIMASKKKLERNQQLLTLALAESPKDPFVLYGLGVAAVQSGQLELALQWFELSRQYVPEQAAYRPTLYRDAVKVLLSKNRPHEAETWIKEVVNDYPDYAELHLLHGQCLKEQGLLEEALLAYTLATESHSDRYVTESGADHATAFLYLGDTAYALERYEEASRYYNRAIEQQPDNEAALLGFIAALSELNVQEEDISLHLEKQRGSLAFPEAAPLIRAYEQAGFVSALARICSQHLHSPHAMNGLIQAWFQMGRYIEAHELIRHLLRHTKLYDDERESLTHLQALCAWQAYIQGNLTVADQSFWSPKTIEAYSVLCRFADQFDRSEEQDVRGMSIQTVSLMPNAESKDLGTHDQSESAVTTDATPQLAQDLPAETNGSSNITEPSSDSSHMETNTASEQQPVPVLSCSQEAENLLAQWVIRLGQQGHLASLRQWVNYSAPWDLRCAKALFQAGDRFSSAHFLLKIMAEERLDAEGALLLGELLLEANQYLEAIDLLEGSRRLQDSQVGAIDMDARRDRMLALAYLKQSAAHLREAVRLKPEMQDWQEQLQMLHASIQQVSRMPWQTVYTPLQRRNIRIVQQTSLKHLHDREK